MIRKDEGVVLKRGRKGDTSVVATLLSREGGKIRLIAKGAMGAKSPFRGALEPGYHLEVLYYYKEDRTQYFLKEVHVLASAWATRRSLPELAGSLAVFELLDQVCFWGNPEPGVLSLLLDYLRSQGGADPLFVFLAFQLKLLEVLGAAPHVSSCSVCGDRIVDGFYHPSEGTASCAKHSEASQNRLRLSGEAVALFGDIQSAPLQDVLGRQVDPDLRKLLGRLLHRTYTFHVQGYTLPEALKLIPKYGSDRSH